ncbi:MAG: hypothetical protein HYU41_24550 [Candidatus Rokubacteria bacterium]|nr:hypothetical protein [Candidatus Rokubacteria bacterium]
MRPEEQAAVLLFLFSLGEPQPSAAPGLSPPAAVEQPSMESAVLGTWLSRRSGESAVPDIEVRFVPGAREGLVFAYVTLGTGATARSFRSPVRFANDGLHVVLGDGSRISLRSGGLDELVGEQLLPVGPTGGDKTEGRPVMLWRFKRQ